ncbi:MAG TPA: molybdate ABC transporter substrate-binding protein [Acidimicrobiia bacterium]|nr:molybdate ABC transporter substrate-binding protein [Acidimicrobiia bacterium]
MRIAVVLALGCMLGACGGAERTEREELIVSAAASLHDAFEEIESDFETANPNVDVVLNLAGSSTLREQILDGAPADVYAPAAVPHMDAVVDAGAVLGEPVVFARNRLQIAVPAGNPGEVESLHDFADAALFIGLCSEGVPCGDHARATLAKAGIAPSIDSNEPDVRALLTKIAEGELDAGITYVTDVAGADGTVEGIDLPKDVNVIVEYPIAVLAASAHRDLAAAFVEFVITDRGQEVLGQRGFSPP